MPQTPFDALQKGKNYFFGIGINTYTDFAPLLNARKDIEDITDLLTTHYYFDPNHSILLRDEQATRENIIEELEILGAQLKPDDRLLIYYSGHGFRSGERGFWIPVDAKRDRFGSYISNAQVRDVIQSIKARHILLISDSCFSASLLVRNASRDIGKTFQNWDNDPSRYVFISGKGVVSDGEKGKNSPFAAGILKHLRNNEAEALNIVSLADQVTKEIQFNYEQQAEISPLFQAGHGGGQFIFFKKQTERDEWQAALMKNTEGGYLAYLDKYENGQFAAEAEAKLLDIADEKEWQLATLHDAVFYYRQYLRKFRNGKYTATAQAKLNAIREQEEADRKEQERVAKIEADKKEQERLAKIEADKKEHERLTKIEADKKEQERLAKIEADKKEQERLAKIEADKKEHERLAKLESDRKEQERLAKRESAEKTTISASAPYNRKEKESFAKLEAERKRQELLAKIEADRREKEQLENQIEEKKNLDFFGKDVLNQNSKLKYGVLMHSIPLKMQLNNLHRCIIRLAYKKSEILRNLPSLAKDIEIREKVRIENKMEVSFEPNSHFLIIELTNKEQLIERGDYTEWDFDVRPLKLGKFPLTFKITVVLPNGKKEAILTESIEVGIEPTKTSMEFIESDFEFSNDNISPILFLKTKTQSLDKTLSEKERVRILIGNNKIIEAIEVIFIYASEKNQSQLKNDTALLKNRFIELQQQIDKGIVSFSDANIEKARLTNSILNLANELEDSFPTDEKELEFSVQLEADKKEKARLAKSEAYRKEQERLAKIEADRKEQERLAKIEADKKRQQPVEPSFFEKNIVVLGGVSVLVSGLLIYQLVLKPSDTPSVNPPVLNTEQTTQTQPDVITSQNTSSTANPLDNKTIGVKLPPNVTVGRVSDAPKTQQTKPTVDPSIEANRIAKEKQDAEDRRIAKEKQDAENRRNQDIQTAKTTAQKYLKIALANISGDETNAALKNLKDAANISNLPTAIQKTIQTAYAKMNADEVEAAKKNINDAIFATKQ